MTDRTYLKRRAEQAAHFASKANDRRAAAAHGVMAAAYFRQLAVIAELDALEFGLRRAPQL